MGNITPSSRPRNEMQQAHTITVALLPHKTLWIKLSLGVVQCGIVVEKAAEIFSRMFVHLAENLVTVLVLGLGETQKLLLPTAQGYLFP